MTTPLQQKLINEWWRLGKERDQCAEPGEANRCEDHMARIETKLAAWDINPAAYRPEAEPEIVPPVEQPKATVDPEFAKTLSEQERRNYEHWLNRK